MSDGLAADEAELDTWGSLEQLSRSLHVRDADLAGTLDAILAAVLSVVPDLRGAGLNLLVDRRFEPQAVLGEAPHELDRLQKSLNSGPCIEASQEQMVVDISDTRSDGRWPEYCRRAAELGVLSMLCLPLWVDGRRLGSLSLYCASPNGFDERTGRLAGLLATHAALALSDAQRTAHLRQALVNRDTIGQAKGILMERHRITADEAFSLLSRASQMVNRKLADVAETVTRTGALPNR